MTKEELIISKIWVDIQTKLRREEENEDIQTVENRSVSLCNKD